VVVEVKEEQKVEVEAEWEKEAKSGCTQR